MDEPNGERNIEAEPLQISENGLPLIEFREIEMELPGFTYLDKVPVLELEFPDVGDVVLHHFNTAIVLYESGDSGFGHMDHVVVNDPQQLEHPLFIFPDPENEDTRIPGIDRLIRAGNGEEWFNELVDALSPKQESKILLKFGMIG